jgi:hypothetical protein
MADVMVWKVKFQTCLNILIGTAWLPVPTGAGGVEPSILYN